MPWPLVRRVRQDRCRTRQIYLASQVMFATSGRFRLRQRGRRLFSFDGAAKPHHQTN
jgi:hypothetical protein